MSLYVDTSALLKRYIEEADSPQAEAHLLGDPLWITARHTAVEVRRNLSRLLRGPGLSAAKQSFAADWRRMHVVELDVTTCEAAMGIAEVTGARSLDALHLAAAQRVGVTAFLTFELRLSQAARTLGLIVVGV